MTATPVLPDVNLSNAATRQIAAFRKQFGEGHFYLACHAALPLALTPDLLYYLWANFQRDIHGRLLDIPWIAVTDLLLSSLCEPVGYELYEMDVAIQKALILQLQQDPCFGQERVRELADFVMAYVAQQLESSDLDMRDFAQTQNWRAVAYTNPAEAAHSIASVLAQLSLEDSTEWIRMSALLETLAEPLSDYPSLLTYAAAMADFLRGKEAEAAAKFGQILDVAEQFQVAGVNLPVPAKMVPTYPEPVASLQPNWAFRLDFLRQHYRWLTLGAVTTCSLVGIVFYLTKNQDPPINIASSPNILAVSIPICVSVSSSVPAFSNPFYLPLSANPFANSAFSKSFGLSFSTNTIRIPESICLSSFFSIRNTTSFPHTLRSICSTIRDTAITASFVF